jgi:phosphatidylserine decarboxylase
MLEEMNRVLTSSPEYNETPMVGCPINAILNWPMGTVSGYAVFLNDKVNVQLKRILNVWGEFLKSPASRATLNDDPENGWLGEKAMKKMSSQMHMHTFEEEFICDVTKPHYGYVSWDDFFTRRFRDGRRPVAFPEDNFVISNPCESAPYHIQENIKYLDTFWIKGQRYSLKHIFNNDAYANHFVGGTIYQAFLSPTSYHRWHSPVNGVVVAKYLIDGTYFSESRAAHYDYAAPNESQAYLTELASRGILIIDCDNIGWVAMVVIGMAEVSSCDITVPVGQRVRKGDELGMFHFGGSSFCLVFPKEMSVSFNFQHEELGTHSKNLLLNIALAEVKPNKRKHSA